jgi:hypothetical protein
MIPTIWAESALSRTTAEPDAPAPADGPSARARVSAAWRSPVNTVIVAATVLALGLRLYQFTRPGYLLGVTEYDDGSYFGSAVYLLRGILPYRDFIFVQPPGITLLMTPAALLGKAAGTAAGMTAGRVLTALASTAGVALLGLLVRHRGVLTTLIACGLLAVFPDSVAAAHTVLVEPWLTLFCLAGAVAVFDRDRLASDRRLVWGGVAFGFAGAVEAWAIIPVVVIFALSVRRIRRAAGFAAGVAAGFLVPVAPFAVLAPVRFYRSLIVAQIAPRAAASRVQDWIRVREMTGLSDLSPVSHANLLIRGFHLAEQPVVTTVAVVLTVLVLAGPAVALLTHRPPAPLDWFALVTAVGVAGMFLWPSQFHYHFSAFLAPFLGLAVALPAGRLVGALRLAPSGQPDGTGQALQQLATGLAGFVIVACAFIQAGAESQLQPYTTPAAIAGVERAVPPGSCVGTDSVSALILANRLISDVPGCSPMLDGLGTDLALSAGRKPGTGAGSTPAVAGVWWQAFTHAHYIWLTPKNARRVAWSARLRAYFGSHFTWVLSDPSGDMLYRRQRSGG